MSFKVRILLVIAAVFTLMWVFSKIRKLKVRLQDSIFWVGFSVLLLLLAFGWPLILKVSDMIGLTAPSLIVLIIVIGMLYEKVFTLSMLVSKLQDENAQLSAEVALRYHSQEKMRLEREKEKEEKVEVESHEDHQRS